MTFFYSVTLKIKICGGNCGIQKFVINLPLDFTLITIKPGIKSEKPQEKHKEN